MDPNGKTIWLIGASEGLGRALAAELDAAGAHLVLSARNETRLSQLCDGLTNARPLPLDVTDPDDVRHAAGKIGEIDGVIYNAGAYDPMSTADWASDAVLNMVEVNFTGSLHVLDTSSPALSNVARAKSP